MVGPAAARGPENGATGIIEHLRPVPRSRGMTGSLVRKLLRDVRVGLIVLIVLLIAFQCLWAKVTQRISLELLPQLRAYLSVTGFLNQIFSGPGKIILALAGGESIRVYVPQDMMSISYV